MTITHLLDFALPYTAEDRRCGMKRKIKTERRIVLAKMLDDKRNGKTVDLNKIPLMIDFAIFEAKVNTWTGSLKTY